MVSLSNGAMEAMVEVALPVFVEAVYFRIRCSKICSMRSDLCFDGLVG